MNIAIDVSQIVYDTGVSNYTKSLVRHLLEIDKKNSYKLFAGTLRMKKEVEKFYSSLRGNFEGKTFMFPPYLANLVWNNLHLTKVEDFVGKVDIYHSSDWTQAPSDARKVTTVHDLVPLKFPKLSDPKIISVHNRRLDRVFKEVDKIIVPSFSTEEDIINIGVPKERIVVIPEAVDNNFKRVKDEEIEETKKKYRIFGNYLLSVGVGQRKNTARIIDTFEKVKADKDLRLVIVGYGKEAYKDTRGVMFLGKVPENDMPSLYSGAKALVYTSIYEGFGLPILEAFQTRTPVVTSNLGSMKEVAEDGAVLVDPYDVDSIALGVIKALKERKSFVKKASKIVRKYSWQKTATETLKVYNSLA